eukprot:scaffold31603_cov124-Isochrysis_galbana.AAC.2
MLNWGALCESCSGRRGGDGSLGSRGSSTVGEHERSVKPTIFLSGEGVGVDSIGEQPPSIVPPPLLLVDDSGFGEKAAGNGEQASSLREPIFLQPPTRFFRGDLVMEPGRLPQYPSYGFSSEKTACAHVWMRAQPLSPVRVTGVPPLLAAPGKARACRFGARQWAASACLDQPGRLNDPQRFSAGQIHPESIFSSWRWSAECSRAA